MSRKRKDKGGEMIRLDKETAEILAEIATEAGTTPEAAFKKIVKDAATAGDAGDVLDFRPTERQADPLTLEDLKPEIEKAEAGKALAEKRLEKLRDVARSAAKRLPIATGKTPGPNADIWDEQTKPITGGGRLYNGVRTSARWAVRYLTPKGLLDTAATEEARRERVQEWTKQRTPAKLSGLAYPGGKHCPTSFVEADGREFVFPPFSLEINALPYWVHACKCAGVRPCQRSIYRNGK